MKQFLMKSSLIFAFIVFSFAGIFSVNCSAPSIDIAPPDVSDLIVKYEEIPAEENAFTYFDRAGHIIEALERRENYIFDIINAENYDPAKAEYFLKENREIIELLEQGLKCAKMQFPKVERGIDSALPYLSSFREMARFESNNAYHLFRKGYEKEGLNAALKVVKFGRMIQNGKGAIINYLVGTTIKSMGLQRFRDILVLTTLKPHILKPYIKLLDEGDAPRKGLADTFRTEFLCSAGLLDRFPLGQGQLPFSYRSFTASYNFQPNWTKLLFAETIRRLIVGTSLTYSETPRALKIRVSFFECIPVPNRVGIELHNRLVPAQSRVIVQMFNDMFDAGATRLTVALKCYKSDKGELPEKLDALVPDYIEKIPLDAYDGKPLRYSKEKKIIYSVGKDLKDDGGPKEDEWGDNAAPGKVLLGASDPAVRINF